MSVVREWVSPLAPGDGDPRHGLNGYTNLGCRCDVCREALRVHQNRGNASRAERLKRDPSLATHGRASTYRNWICRCRPCTDAYAAERARQRKADR